MLRMTWGGGVRGCLLVCLFAAAWTAPGCATIKTRRNDWSKYEGPGAEYFRQQEVVFPVPKDPLEPVNRGVGSFNNMVLLTIVTPFSSLYRFVVPRYVRERGRNFFGNLLYPVRLVNNLLQWKLHGAKRETQRFLINSTWGIVGLYERAEHIEPSEEDLGQSMAVPGWTRSTFLTLPFLGPNTVRDSVGLLGDTLLDPATYFPPTSQVRFVNDLSDQAPPLGRFVQSSYDPYQLAKVLYVRSRDVEAEDFVHPDEACPECAENQTLQVAFWSFKDQAFPGRGRTDFVRSSATGRLLPYTYWLQPKPAPLVFILPGLAGHRLSGSTLALAEMIVEHGFSAVAISSAFNFEFIDRASTIELPGFAPTDARDIHVALHDVRASLERDHPGRFTSRVLIGLSLGAFHALYVAAAEWPELPEDEFDLVVAVNPPVRLEYGLHQLDAYYNAPLEEPLEQRELVIRHTVLKALQLGNGTLTPSVPGLFSQNEARFLIGLSYRASLQDVIFQTQQRHDRGVLKTKRSHYRRSAAYREIAEFSFKEYFYAFVLPCLDELRDDVTNDEAGASKAFELCDLRSLADSLRDDPRIRAITNDNDFLLDDDDRLWLEGTLGDRCHALLQGGHLGNLHEPDVQARIMTTITDALRELNPPHQDQD